jgi:ribosomal protein S18 acetylase RimI-like enzyme
MGRTTNCRIFQDCPISSVSTDNPDRTPAHDPAFDLAHAFGGGDQAMMPRGNGDATVVISEIGVERLEDVRDLWLALHRYHGEIGSRPLVADEDFSWQQRRAQYQRWLEAGDVLLLLAERDGQPVGYVLAHLQDGPDDTYPLGERYAEIYTLSVAPEHRGQGIGGLLMDRVEAQLGYLGIRDIAVSAMVENASALRFYARRGFAPREVKHYRFGQSE